MVRTRINWSFLQIGAYSYARLYPTSSNYSCETYKDNSTILHKELVLLVWVNIDRQSYKSILQTTDEKTSKKALLNKISQLELCIWSFSYSAQINGKDGAALAVRNLFVKPDRFCRWENIWWLDLLRDCFLWWWMEGINLADAQDGLYNADKNESSKIL